ncbi:hypothetical protein AGMMS50230_04530 [Spirochaetia bacterium]|nr:hypothetical protein AGMMS50230_04530 [Spirochaetia bacterium]
MNHKNHYGEITKRLYPVCAALVLLLCSSCARPELTVWSAYPEFKELFTGPGETYKKITINYTSYAGEETASLKPGLFVVDRTAMITLVEAGLTLDLTPIRREEIPAYYKDGLPSALFINAGTGVLCYDPELAGRYLHVSDPAQVQELMGDPNAFIVASFLISERSFGSCAVLPSADELLPAFQHTNSLHRAGLTAAGAEKWFTDITVIFRDRRWDGLSFENGSPRRTVTFFLPPGSSFAVPGGTAPPADWQVIPGPDPESNGGIWLALHRDLFSGSKRTVQKIKEYMAILLQKGGI